MIHELCHESAEVAGWQGETATSTGGDLAGSLRIEVAVSTQQGSHIGARSRRIVNHAG